MFLDNLSAAVQHLCDLYKLSYKAASEQCGLSAKCVGNIARGKTAITIQTLEKLCIGFERTPNDLLGSSLLCGDMGFRTPMPVTHIHLYRSCNGVTGYPVCPQCNITLEREYQKYCDRCGQYLSWRKFSKAIIIPPIK